MNTLYLLLTAYNEAESIKASIQSIRMFADVDNLSVIVADNHSTDHLRSWAADQKDITYVYMDEGKFTLGALLNQVIGGLHLNGDICIMGSGFLLTPFCLSNMQKILCADPCTGAAAPVSNTGNMSALLNAENITDYEAVVEHAASPQTPHSKKVIGLLREPVLIRADVLHQLGEFDEELDCMNLLIRDYCFRMILNHWNIKICENSFMWNIASDTNCPPSPVELKNLEKKWGMHYFNIMYNAGLITMIHHDKDAEITVLEVGCDCGATLLEIMNQYPDAHVYGCEINEKAAEIASLFATISVSNIEEQTLNFPPKTFDYIIFGDVLEHLRDPLKTIQYCRTFLKNNGSLIASIPNLMHISVMEDLMNGNFTYTEAGLLDKTHIHLFTFNEIVRMFQAGGYTINNLVSSTMPLSVEQNQLIDKLLACGSSAKRYMYEAFQYIVSATPVLN